ncbi:MAG TPA: substrate-binding domain-containing protein [Actinomycetota bacterium]|nr:substrate-binding domain-containing protein [Actinomycetota bacterium]
MGKRRTWLVLVSALSALSLVAAACGGGDDGGGGSGEELTGSLNISGSSTVEPITSLVAERFRSQNPAVEVAVDGPGTSDGFELFCNGETDISDASRPIEQEEIDACAANGIEPIEIEVGLDALSVIVDPANPQECVNFGDLYALFGPESEGIDTWSDANPLASEVGGLGLEADLPLTIVAPGEESGTYGSFIDLTGIEDIALEQGVPEDEAATLRADYQLSADDNVIVDNAAGTEGGLGFVGFAFAENAGESVKELQVDGGEGCVAPSPDSVIDGTYPLARSLYIYVNPSKLEENPALGPFVDFYLSEEGIASVEEVQYVPLPTDRLDAARSAWEAASA